MFHACAGRFNVMENLKNFAKGTKQGLNLATRARLQHKHGGS